MRFNVMILCDKGGGLRSQGQHPRYDALVDRRIERAIMEKETKADWIEDKCPRCLGTGADPDQPRQPRPLPDDPISGERRFEVSAVPCSECRGTGRMPKGK